MISLWSAGLAETTRHILQLAVDIWLQSASILILGLAAGETARRRGPLAASAVHRATLVSVILSAAISISLAGHIKALWTIELPGPATATATATALRASQDAPGSPCIIRSVPGGTPAALSGRTSLEILRRRHPFPLREGEGGRLAAAPPSSIGIDSLPSRDAASFGNTPRIRGATYAALVALWCLGTLAQLVWLLACHMSLRTLRRLSTPILCGPLVDLLGELCVRLNVKQPTLVGSRRVHNPFVAGVRRPCIFVPLRFADDFNMSEQRAILVHELAHIRQRDCAWNIAFRAAGAVLWTQPLLWVLRRRWQAASEEACDAWVLTLNCPAELYANCLLRLAECTLGAHPQRAAGLGVLSFRSLLGRRIQWILEGAHLRRLELSPWMRAVAIAGAVVAAVVGPGLVASPAISMVQRQIHQMLPVNGHGYVSDRPLSVPKWSPSRMKPPHSKLVFPALLALAAGSLQVNIPAVASPTLSAPTIPVSSTTPTDAIAPVIVIRAASGNAAGNTYSCEYHGAPITSVLAELFKAVGASYVFDPDVAGTVDIRLDKVSFLTALQTVLHANTPLLGVDFHGVRFCDYKDSPPFWEGVRVGKGSVIHVWVAHEAPASVGTFQGPPDDSVHKQIYTLPINNLLASQLLGRLTTAYKSVIPRNDVVTVDAGNCLMVLAGAEEFARIQGLVRDLDVAPSQVSVVVKMATVSADDLANLGIDAASIESPPTPPIPPPSSSTPPTPPAPPSPPNASSIGDIATLDRALADGKLHLDATYNLSTVSGTPTSIHASFHMNGHLDRSSVLTVNPTATGNGSIVTSVHVEDTEAGLAGVAQTRSYDMTSVLVNGQTMLVEAIADEPWPGDAVAEKIRLIFVTAALADKTGAVP